ncbi:MAG TPA: ComEC/Rec2 family competence protein [Pyrinomonadaceae bacterium]|nr:ComEC/Rec2 family competence protein [Pyrinomonadaceae bacterium]
MIRTTAASAVQSLSQRSAGQPLAQLSTAFALGILGANYFSPSVRFLISTAVLATLLTGLALVKSRLRLATVFVTVAMLLVGSIFGSVDKSIPTNQLRRLLDNGTIAVGEPVELTGVLEREPEIAPERLYLQLRVEKIRSRLTAESSGEVKQGAVERDVSGVVTLLASVPGGSIKREFEQLDLRYGARIRVMTLLERTDSFRNPGVSPFTEYLDQKGYDATAFIKSPLLVERLENERIFLPLAYIYEWRRQLQTQIDSHFSRETAGVLDAAVLGNRYNLSHSTSERFREGGTFHVLVISGLHITFIGGLVLLLARRFTTNTVWHFMLSMSVLWAYVFAVGAETSVVRAALMFTIVLFAPVIFRHASSLNSLGGAALALLAWRPADLFDPSLQLTFVSVLAIVIFAWPLLQKMLEVGSWRPTRETPYPPACSRWFRALCESLFWSERKAKRELERANYVYRLFKAPLAARLERLHLQRALRYAFAAIVVSIAVQISLLPFLVIYFHRLSFASLVLNIVVSLLMAAMAVVAACALLIAPVSNTLAAPLISLADLLTWLMAHSVDPFSRVGAASIRLPEYSGWTSVIYGLYYLPLFVLARSLFNWRPLDLSRRSHKKQRWLRLTVVALSGHLLALGLIVAHPLSQGRAPGKLRVDFLDVGQGDAALVTFPDNTILLVDGGGRPGPFQRDSQGDEETFEHETRTIGEAVVSEYLWWRGLDHVDYILATHADADHIDGLNDVVRNFHVRAALIARTPEQDEEFVRFAKTLAENNIPTRLVASGDVLRFGEVTAKVLWPVALANANAPSGNNDSVVLRLQYGDRALLLTGDIEMSGENRLLRAGEDLRADVVKVAHHGSRTSSTESLVAATDARFAIVSVGQVSIFGHPNAEVVARWKSSGAQVLTTGNSGTITVLTDGGNLELKTFVPAK